MRRALSPRAVRAALRPRPSRHPNARFLEAAIQRAVARYARGRGFYCVKFVSPQRRSVPDYLLISPGGRFFFVEFKRWGERLTAKQRDEVRTLRRYGARVYVIDDIAEGKALVNAYLER